jgi:hypothetical protein
LTPPLVLLCFAILGRGKEVGSVLGELTVVEQRFNAVLEVLRDGLKVVEVAERYGVSRQAVHGWLRRYAADGLDALADRSHRPDNSVVVSGYAGVVPAYLPLRSWPAG